MREAIVIGEGKSYLTALVQIDYEKSMASFSKNVMGLFCAGDKKQKTSAGKSNGCWLIMQHAMNDKKHVSV
jgi:hypothetical protein